MTNQAPWTAAILDLLADGEWHPRELVIRAAMVHVPPGKAHRQGELNRHRHNPGARTRGDDDTSTATGARLIVNNAIWHQVRRGSVETDGALIRLAPQAPDT